MDLDDSLGLLLCYLMVLFVVLGNIRCLAKVFEAGPEDLMNRTLVSICLNTGWKSGLIVFLTTLAVWLFGFLTQTFPQVSFSEAVVSSALTCAFGGALLGVLTGLAACLTCTLGLKVSQVSATLALLLQVDHFLRFAMEWNWL